MAITMTQYDRLYPLVGKPNRYAYNVLFNGTGDGSGGAVSASPSFSVFQSKDVVWLTGLHIYTTDSTTAFDCKLDAGDWSALKPGYSSNAWLYCALFPATDWITNGSWYVPQPMKDIFIPRDLKPFLLGNPTVLTPTIYVNFLTNTNTKSYFTHVTFLIERRV